MLLKRLFLFLLILATIRPVALSQYWQQQVNYRIVVSLNDTSNSLFGDERIEYTNHSPDTLRYIWFHLWPNAYKTDKTAFSDQLLENGNTKFYFSDADQKGYINRLDFKVNGITAATEDHPHYIDVVRVMLPSPLLPGNTITISTPFHVKLPYNFSRGGHDGQSYQITQWYPKPAVYDKDGWHPMPYLDQGEFYSDFGSFDVSITLPANYVVAATGELQSQEEIDWLKSRATFTWKPVKQKIKSKSGSYKTIYEQFPPSDRTLKTIRYRQDRVHDFAWFADKRFIVEHDTCLLPSGRTITVQSFYTPAEAGTWKRSTAKAKDALRHYSRWIGEYPYNVASVVQGPKSFGGGMEYPTITVISPMESESELDNTIAHELGHNWFYGVLATNEREHPWMDEGMNSFYESKYGRSKYRFYDDAADAFLENAIAQRNDQPIETASPEFSEANYSLIAYHKTAKWMEWLEAYLGPSQFKKGMQEYFEKWKFRHPAPADFKASLESATGRNLDSAFSLIGKTGWLPGMEKKGTSFLLMPGIHSLPYINSTKSANVFSVLPAAGINSYDKFMIGLMVHNFRLPLPKLKVFIAPMYATGSKSFSGIGLIQKSFLPDGVFRQINLNLAAATFSNDQFTDQDGHKTFLRFTKLVPGLRFVLRPKDSRSTLNRFIQFKTFIIGEDGLRFYRDTVIAGNDTTISNRFNKIRDHRTLNQLMFVAENNRALYPYRGELKIEQATDFLRAAFTGNYFFNYVKGGGLSVRLFAGKFMYTGAKTFSKQFATDRYHLNMTGANGYEDYTYSDYFVGRNKFEGAASQQIMERDGAFKVRTDLLADKIGKTDDWLVAVNFSSTVPKNINPLSLLPFRIPLKVFVDVGTYAEPWKRNATGDRFLFDAGLQLPILKETINVYLPLFYSSVFKDYIQSTLPEKNRLLKKISFSIDISHFTLRKFDRTLDF